MRIKTKNQIVALKQRKCELDAVIRVLESDLDNCTILNVDLHNNSIAIELKKGIGQQIELPNTLCKEVIFYIKETLKACSQRHQDTLNNL